MRTASARDVLFLDALIRNEPAHVPARPMRQIVDTLDRLRQSGLTARWYEKKTRKVFIRELQISEDDTKVCILLYETDAEASGASFANMDTDEQRDEDKREREGRPESAHFIMMLTHEADQGTRYLAVLEESSRLPRGLVQNYLNGLLKDAAKRWKERFSVPHIDGSLLRGGSPRPQLFHPLLDLQGHLSADFQSDLAAGILRGISLESSRADRLAFGEPRSVIPRRNDIKLSPRGSWRDDPLGKINDTLHLGKHRTMSA
jgi:hypothetical protein